MFLSMDDAGGAVASALNCRAGEAALRFLAVRGVDRVGIYSRSGALKVPKMTVRSAIASNKIRTGTMYGLEQTE